jgi:hypothetical protein
MRVNIYAEEMTDRVEVVTKEIQGTYFTAIRLYLELPVTQHMDDGRGYLQHKGPFYYRPGDDDSAAVTFWGKQDLRPVLRKMLATLDRYYEHREACGNSVNAAMFTNNDLKAGTL